MLSYQNTTTPFADGEHTEEALPVQTWATSVRPSYLSSKLSITLLLSCVVTMAIVLVSSRTDTQPTQAGMLLGAPPHATARACTFDECIGSSCNNELAPFTCLFHNGGPHGGCSAIPWIPETCDDECFLGGCADLDIPEGVDDCDHPCDKDFCDLGRLCGSEVPYQCTSGASTFGCSDDKYMWTIRVLETSCGSCCNIKYC